MNNTLKKLNYLQRMQNNGLEKMMYRLWLSGRELFHSNMISYLLEETDFGIGAGLTNHFLEKGWGKTPITWCQTCKQQNYDVRILRNA